ncbi:hypothetical protein BB559_002166 [Furculomyces boomerangus]|uniref:Peptidase S8/S53 domain-containing protein n=1 Tax=Furculomyces boomerangus TaxID=61424 RepID=A0A2T9YXF9_9FUNG|nr:hypothetical protein BB559_002166 [Furculomyces boomerangus]
MKFYKSFIVSVSVILFLAQKETSAQTSQKARIPYPTPDLAAFPELSKFGGFYDLPNSNNDERDIEFVSHEKRDGDSSEYIIGYLPSANQTVAGPQVIANMLNSKNNTNTDSQAENNGSVNTVMKFLNEDDVAKLKSSNQIAFVEKNIKASLHPVELKPPSMSDFVQQTNRVMGNTVSLNRPMIDYQRTYTNNRNSWKSQRYSPWQLGAISSYYNITSGYFPYGQEYYYPHTKKKVIAYVVDSGVNPDHFELKGKVRIGENFVVSEPNQDLIGHGTAVASLIAGKVNGVSKNTKIVSVKVIDQGGLGDLNYFLMAFKWIINDKKKNYPKTPALINFSINVNGSSVALENALMEASKNNILVFCSAGNYNEDACNHAPAGSKYTLSSGSIQHINNLFDNKFSNYGTCVDIFAPGKFVFTAQFNNNQVRPNVGTSFASAITAGVGALILSSNPTFTAPQLKDAVLSSGLSGIIGGLPPNTKNLLVWNGYTGPHSTMTFI